MDIAVLSDIHGNHVAFERCIHYIENQGIDTFIFLGDYLGEFPYPEKTMELLYELKQKYTCYFIRGNREDYWLKHYLNGENDWIDYNSASGSLFYTYQHLTARDFNFFKELAPAMEISPSPTLPPLVICHGSPRNVREKMLSDERTYALMEQISLPIILCGHTHVQCELKYHGHYSLNPGSVGVALDSSAEAQFLILHEKNTAWSWEMISLCYDTRQVLDELSAEQLDRHAPYWCLITKQLLEGGSVSHGTVLAKAMDLCQLDTGICNWPDIPEKYWKSAYEALCSSDTGNAVKNFLR